MLTDKDLELKTLDKLNQLKGIDEMTVGSNDEQYGETKAFENVNLITTSGSCSSDNNITDSSTWKRTKPNKINNEASEMPNV